MARKEAEKMKPESVERLKLLCREQGVNQKQLAAMIPTSPQTINKAFRGERLTKDMAESIVNAFPEAQYSAAWLLGLSAYKHESDREQAVQEWKDIYTEASIKAMAEIRLSLASLYKYAGFPSQATGDGMTIQDSRTGKSVSFDDEGLREIEDDIFAFLRYRLNKLVEKGR